METQSTEIQTTAGTDQAAPAKKKRGPYKPRQPKAGAKPKAEKPLTIKQVPGCAIRFAHAGIMQAFREQRIVGVQRPATKAERILESTLREVMAMLAPFAADADKESAE